MPTEGLIPEEISDPDHLPSDLTSIVAKAARDVCWEGTSMEEALAKAWREETGESLSDEEFDDPNARGLVVGHLVQAALEGESDPPNKVFPDPDGPEQTQSTELSSEQIWFGNFRTRFDALTRLHKGIEWADVERSLKADPEAMRKLQALDEKGHKMNVFGEDGDEFIFASGWNNYEEVSADHRNIVFDAKAQEWLAENRLDEKCNGNATDIVKALGADLAGTELHEQLRKAIEVNGWAWLKTDATTRKTGFAFHGGSNGVRGHNAHAFGANGSFRAALRVKKAFSL